MNKPPTVEVNGARIGAAVNPDRVVHLLDPHRAPDGGWAYGLDLRAFGLDGVLTIRVREALSPDESL